MVSTGGTDDQETYMAWGVAFNVNENLSLSYGERDVEFRDNQQAQLPLLKKVKVLL